MIAVAIVLTLITSLAPRPAAAAAGGSYENEAFGFSVEWDEEVWTGKELDLGENAVGISFESVTSWGSIQAAGYEVDNPEECLDGLIDIFADDDGEKIDDYGIAPIRYDRIESIDGAASELVTYTFLGERGNDLDLVMFVSCSPLLDGDAALEIFITTTVDVYEDVMVEWEDVVAGIVTGEGTGIGEPKAERDQVGDGQFSDTELGFSFEWDPDVWESTVLDEDGLRGAELIGDVSYAYIVATLDSGLTTSEECVDSLVASFGEFEVVENLRTAPSRLAKPEAHPEAGAALLTFNDTDREEKMVLYNECRVSEDGIAFSAQFIAPYSDYEDELVIWQETLDSIEIDA
jgi:hypothetical protein